MWNKQNAYNNPEAQMGRLKDAGLNPNLVYGSGSVAGNTSSQLPKYQAPKLDFSQTQQGIADTAQTLGQYMSMKKLGAEINYIDANTIARNTQTDYLIKQADKLGIDINLAKDTYDSNVSQAKAKDATMWQVYEKAKNDAITSLENTKAKRLANQYLAGQINRQTFENSIINLDLTPQESAILKFLMLIVDKKM